MRNFGTTTYWDVLLQSLICLTGFYLYVKGLIQTQQLPYYMVSAVLIQVLLPYMGPPSGLSQPPLDVSDDGADTNLADA